MRQSWLNSVARTVAVARPGSKRLISPRVSAGADPGPQDGGAVGAGAVDFQLAADDDEDLRLEHAFLDDDPARVAREKFAVGTEQIPVVILEMTDPAKGGQGGFG